MEEKKVLVKNIETSYKVIGQGEPMLILHGWGSKGERWQAVADLLAQKNIQCIIPDLPGFGATPEPQTPWNLDNYVDFIKEFSQKVPVLNDEFYLLGHSFGGAIAAKFSIRYPQQVRRLFLAAAACIRKKTVRKSYLHKISKIIKTFSFLPFYQKVRTIIYKYIIRKSDYIFVEGIMKETYVKVILEDLSNKLPSIKVPTIIIWGDKDELTPVEYSHIINSKIEGSKLIILANLKHDLDRHKKPEVLAEKILENI